MPATSQPSAQVFISYSHKDKEWLDRLNVHLAPIKRNHAFVIWDDTTLQPGMQWDAEIRKALSSIRAAILLLSADFLASEYIYNEELPAIMEAAATKGATILSIMVSPCYLDSDKKLAAIQTVNNPKSPLVNLKGGKREEVFVQVARQVMEILNRQAAVPERPHPPTQAMSRPAPTVKNIIADSDDGVAMVEAFTKGSKGKNAMTTKAASFSGIKTKAAPRPTKKDMAGQIEQQLHLLNDNPKRGRFLLVSAGEVYTQYLNYDDTDDVLFEVVSNKFLPKEDQLSKERMSELLAIGFDKPSKNSPNYTMSHEPLTKKSIPRLAKLTVDVLCDIYGVAEGAMLSFEQGAAAYR